MRTRPILLGISAAILFGAATPASKWLLTEFTPFQLAGILYFGAAAGVAPAALAQGGMGLPRGSDHRNRARLLGAVVFGGILGPVALLFGLTLAEAASVSLWLNLELAATAVLGVCFFRDNLSRNGWLGVGSALSGAALLSWHQGATGLAAGSLVLLACVCWGLDNHLTALIDGITPSQTTLWKGAVAGSVNLAIGTALSPVLSDWRTWVAALLVGSLSYGASIVLYIKSAQGLGATRAQVLFSSAPFFGAGLSVALLGESISAWQVMSALLFILAVAFLLAESHAHLHTHEALSHEHAHRHDDGHHSHIHPRLPAWVRHTHWHDHEPVSHRHPHFPDLHHRHKHQTGDE